MYCFFFFFREFVVLAILLQLEKLVIVLEILAQMINFVMIVLVIRMPKVKFWISSFAFSLNFKHTSGGIYHQNYLVYFFNRGKKFDPNQEIGGAYMWKKNPWYRDFRPKKKKLPVPGIFQQKKIPGYQDLQRKFFGRYAPDQNTELYPNWGGADGIFGWKGVWCSSPQVTKFWGYIRNIWTNWVGRGVFPFAKH